MTERVLSIDTFDKPHHPAGTVCGSCGVNPPYLDFAMCAPCRIALGLPVDEKTVAANNKPKEAVGKKWTPEEDAIVRANAHLGIAAVTNLLEDRTQSQVAQHCRKMKPPVSFLAARRAFKNAQRKEERAVAAVTEEPETVPIPECDLPCSVEPCDGTECTRDDDEDEAPAVLKEPSSFTSTAMSSKRLTVDVTATIDHALFEAITRQYEASLESYRELPMLQRVFDAFHRQHMPYEPNVADIIAWAERKVSLVRESRNRARILKAIAGLREDDIAELVTIAEKFKGATDDAA